MSVDYKRAADLELELLEVCPRSELEKRLSPKATPGTTMEPWDNKCDQASVSQRWSAFGLDPSARKTLAGDEFLGSCGRYATHVENLIGEIRVPVGLAGPIRINGVHANGEYRIPLATTEATLVASFGRGAQLIRAAGGCSTMVVDEGIARAPLFVLESVYQASRFISWIVDNLDELKSKAQAGSRHARLTDVRFTQEGNHVFLHLEFRTGDAAGQNMLTRGVDAVIQFVREACPFKAREILHDGGMSGEKRANHQSFQSVRGKKVIAEVEIPAELVATWLKTTPAKIARTWSLGSGGCALIGATGVHAQLANGLCALFLACGQDPACVAEASVGVTRFEVKASGSLYACVTLPNLIVGTVGGATSLPSQRACLEILGAHGPGKSREFAEICAAVALAGEISVTAALGGRDFALAHGKLSRSAGEPT